MNPAYGLTQGYFYSKILQPRLDGMTLLRLPVWYSKSKLTSPRWEIARATSTWPPPECPPPPHRALPASPRRGIKSWPTTIEQVLTNLHRSRTVSKSSASSYLPSSTASPRFWFLQRQKIQKHFYSQRQLQHLNQDRSRHLLVQLQDHEPIGEPVELARDDEANPGDAGGGASLDQY